MYTRVVSFEWDPNKAAANVRKHGVQFSEALTVFSDEYAITVKDDATLERGDYVIDTAQTHLDGRVASQVDTIGRALFDE